MNQFHLDHPHHESDEAWLILVDRLAATIEDLVREYVDELVSSRIYEGLDLSRGDMTTAASRIFRIFAEQLAGREDDRRALEAARMLGQSRARRGVPLEALVFAIQLDFPLFWRRFVSLSGPDDRQALIDHVDLLHRVIDNYVMAARDEFLKEKSRISKDRSVVGRLYLSRLFGQVDPSLIELEHIAAELGIDSVESFTLAVAHPGSARSLQTVTERLQEEGECFGAPLGSTSCVFWASDRAEVQRVVEASGLPAALYPPVDSLGDLRRAAAGAGALIESLDADVGVIPAEQLLPPVLGAAIDNYVPGLRSKLMAGLETLADGERDRLVQTVEAFLVTGSTKRTARQVDCHRNTVINRLKQFEHLTGLDVNVGRGAALSLMLLSSPSA